MPLVHIRHMRVAADACVERFGNRAPAEFAGCWMVVAVSELRTDTVPLQNMASNSPAI